MVYLSLFLMLPLLSSTDGGTLPTFEALNQTTPVMRKVPRRETPTLPPPYLHLPVFVDSRLPLVEKEHFSPGRGTGQEPLPEPVRDILLPVRPNTSPPSVSGVSVKTSCELKKMQVQVQRSLLGAGEPQSQLKLGTCRASKSTRDYLYFEYDLRMCGTKRTVSSTCRVAQGVPISVCWLVLPLVQSKISQHLFDGLAPHLSRISMVPTG